MNQLIGFGDQEKEKMMSPSVVQSSNRAIYKQTEERVAIWWCWSCGLHIWIAQWLNFFLENIYFFWFCTPSGGKLGQKLDQKCKSHSMVVRYLVELSLIYISAQSNPPNWAQLGHAPKKMRCLSGVKSRTAITQTFYHMDWQTMQECRCYKLCENCWPLGSTPGENLGPFWVQKMGFFY